MGNASMEGSGGDSAASARDSLSPDEFAELVRLCNRVMWNDDPEFWKRLHARSINIIHQNFYAEVPSVEDIENSFEFKEAQPFDDPGVFDAELIAEFVETLMPFAAEADFPLEAPADGPPRFFWNNPAFSYSDAMAYYCTVRKHRPKRILEVGSGFSTLVADAALRANGEGELVLFEPYPKDFLHSLDTVARIDTRFSQQIPVQEYLDLLEDGCLWFIDSTHTVKPGSDCLYLYLKVMPQVKRRVLAHSHDIHLPYPFPKNSYYKQRLSWTEQYLLYAYLLNNPRAQVVYGSRYLARTRRELLERFMGGRYAPGGGSLWYWLNP
jgi:hypothetical protein